MYNTYVRIFLFVIVLCIFYTIMTSYNPTPMMMNKNSEIDYLREEIYRLQQPQQNNNQQNNNQQMAIQQPIMQNNPSLGSPGQLGNPYGQNLNNVYDAIHQFDTSKVTDPLTDPITRNSLLNYGLPYDSYRLIGTLKRISNDVFLEETPYYRQMNALNQYGSNGKEVKYNGVEIGQSFPPAEIKERAESADLDENDKNWVTGYRKAKRKNCKSCRKNKVVEGFAIKPYNDILQLFGMQSSINTSIYFYYTIISDGNSSIKIIINNRNNQGSNELYSGSVIFIPELESSYEVTVNPTIFMTY